MSFKTVAIVQARWDSKRFPGKILEKIDNKSVLGHVISNLKKTVNVNEVCCAIPNTKKCDQIEYEAIKNGATIYRGEEKNVLKRFFYAAKKTNADFILRVTSDCPLTNPEVNERVLENLINENADYSSNNSPPSFPHGLDCEAFTFKTLKMCYEKATKDYELEHVTPWMRENKKLNKINYKCTIPNIKNFRITLDYYEDLILIKKIFYLLNKNYKELNVQNLIKYYAKK